MENKIELCCCCILFLKTFSDDLRRELKNVVKSTPVGIDEPAFTVLKAGAAAEEENSYEIRRYEGFSTCSISMSSVSDISSTSTTDTPIMDIVSSSKSFNTLAGATAGRRSIRTTIDACLHTYIFTYIHTYKRQHTLMCTCCQSHN